MKKLFLTFSLCLCLCLCSFALISFASTLGQNPDYKAAVQSLKLAYGSTYENPTIWVETSCLPDAPGEICGRRDSYFDICYKKINPDTKRCEWWTAKVKKDKWPNIQASAGDVMGGFERVLWSKDGFACELPIIEGVGL